MSLYHVLFSMSIASINKEINYLVTIDMRPYIYLSYFYSAFVFFIIRYYQLFIKTSTKNSITIKSTKRKKEIFLYFRNKKGLTSAYCIKPIHSIWLRLPILIQLRTPSRNHAPLLTNRAPLSITTHPKKS